MQLNNIGLSFLVLFFQLSATVAAYNPAVDACQPSDKDYRGSASTDFLACPVTSAARPWSRHDCTGRGYVVYDYEANTFRVNADSPQGNRLTFHAVCIETKNNIAQQAGHADVSTPPPSAVTWKRLYPGMNWGKCNIENPGTRVEIYSWTMTEAQYQTCKSHPLPGTPAK